MVNDCGVLRTDFDIHDLTDGAKKELVRSRHFLHPADNIRPYGGNCEISRSKLKVVYQPL